MRSKRRRDLVRLVVLACWILTLPPLTAQPQGRGSSEIFEESVEVQVVNLEVVVTDEEDERVTGLGRQEFLLRVDGVEVPIRYFAEIGAPGNDSPNAGGTIRQEPVNFLVFIDDHVSLARDRDLTLGRLRDELGLLRPGDRMAIVAYDGRRISLLSPWSDTVETLESALAEAVERPALGVRWVALGRSRNFIANWIGNATRRSVLAAGSSMRLLPRPPGRKVMLLVAGSWDPLELEGAKNFSPWCLSGPCVGSYVLSSLTDTANQLGYSIYAVDVEGRDVQQSWSREMRLQTTLALLARQTGGRTLLNGERGRVLSIASEDSRSYYSIGFEPGPLPPESRHRIEVEVDRPGLEVRARDSFVAVSERRQRDVETFSAVLGDADPAAPGVPVQLGPSERMRGRLMRVPITVFVPSGELIWLPEDSRYRASFEIGLAAIDVYGNSTVETHTVDLEEAAAARSGEAVHLDFELTLKRRRHRLAVVVRDLLGDASFAATVAVEPPARDAGMVETEAALPDAEPTSNG